MEISWAYQGEMMFAVELPDNTKEVVFESSDSSSVYNGVHFKIPTVSKIVFYGKEGDE